MFERGRVKVMGIVNVTPDSFSGDGLTDHHMAIERGLRMAEAGADIVDVGGESTRPGHTPVPAAEEIRRAIPVVEALAAAGLVVSIDTSKLEVARAAADAGATIVNDVWGLRRSPGIARLAAERGLGLVLMHNQVGNRYPGDLVQAIVEGLSASIAEARRAGVPPDRIAIDPGIGFGKDAGQNLVVLRRLGELRRLGHPLLVGASRKGFLGRLFGQEMPRRIWGTAAVVAVSILRGADIVRVHDVEEMVAVARVAEALRAEREEEPR
ncbi:MAG TPA: dihydropteroate synthase [Candidatus Dormibacteraeota bacterium]|nr:dihydropteroate synthase [Candidatus Dormibacteraeota bacterium]